MAYIAPPTFADNTAPDEDDFNALSDDLAYLNDIRSPHNYPVICAEQDDSDWNANGRRWRWQILHQFNDLAFEYTIGSAALTDITLIYNGTEIGSLSNDENAPGESHAYTISLAALGLTVGNLYTIRLDVDSATGSTLIVNNLFEDVGTPTTGLPRTWAHGEVPTAAYLNTYSTHIENLYDRWEPIKEYNFPVPFNDSTYGTWYGYGSYDIQLTDMKFVRRYRWLHFYGDGAITDPAGIGTAITLDDDNDPDGAVYDLDSSDWIIIGAAYTVTGVDVALESDVVNA